MEYTESQVREVVDSLGVQVDSRTNRVLLCFCPFHDNRYDPAFAINRYNGLWNCFNAACNKRGNLVQLVMLLSDRSYAESKMLIGSKERERKPGELLSDAIDKMYAPSEELPVFPQTVVDQLVENFWNHEPAQEFMFSKRGFNEATCRYFEVGLRNKPGMLPMVVYPVHAPDGRTVVGVVGRSIEGKHFKNSSNMPRSKIVFNLHNARKHSNRAILTESGFDAMMIHQAGFPNAVATMGSSVSNRQLELLDRNFTEIVVFHDNDEAGQKMYDLLDEKSRCRILRPETEDGTMYPEAGRIKDGKPCIPKDACDLTESQIEYMIKRAENGLWS